MMSNKYFAAFLALVVVPLADLQTIDQPAAANDVMEQPLDVAAVSGKETVAEETVAVVEEVVEEVVEVVETPTEEAVEPPQSIELPVVDAALEVEEAVEETVEVAEPVVEESAPVVEESAPVVEESAPVVEDSAPVVEDVKCDAIIPDVDGTVNCDADHVADVPAVEEPSEGDATISSDSQAGLLNSILKFLHLI